MPHDLHAARNPNWKGGSYTGNKGLWAAAIEMAKRELSVAENRVLQLRAAVRTFQRNQARGDAFPGNKAPD